jgi:hypothetical protein
MGRPFERGDGGIRTHGGGFADPCLATWRRRRERDAPFPGRSQSGRWDSNPRSSPWQGDVLPLNHARKFPLPRRCRDPGSNWGHRDFQSRALPTELSRRKVRKRPYFGAGILTGGGGNVKERGRKGLGDGRPWLRRQVFSGDSAERLFPSDSPAGSGRRHSTNRPDRRPAGDRMIHAVSAGVSHGTKRCLLCAPPPVAGKCSFPGRPDRNSFSKNVLWISLYN